MRFEKSFIWTLLSYFISQLCIDIFLVFWVHCSLLYESLNAQPISFNLFLHLYSLYYCFFAFFVRIYVFIKRCLFNHTFLFFPVFSKQRFRVFPFIWRIPLISFFRLHCESRFYEGSILAICIHPSFRHATSFLSCVFIFRLSIIIYDWAVSFSSLGWANRRNGQLSNPLIYRWINIESSWTAALHTRFWVGAVFYQKKPTDRPWDRKGNRRKRGRLKEGLWRWWDLKLWCWRWRRTEWRSWNEPSYMKKKTRKNIWSCGKKSRRLDLFSPRGKRPRSRWKYKG